MLAKLLIVAVSAIASSAWAIDFEDVSPSIYGGGDTFTTEGFQATVLSATSDTGLSGVIVDGSDPTSCFIVDCPSGDASHYFIGVNDGGVDFTAVDSPAGFQAQSFDASFVAPVAGTSLPEPVARLRVFGYAAGTNDFLEATFTLPGQGSDGTFSFTDFSLAGTSLSGVTLSSFGVYACLIDGGRCDSPAANQAQFALDNLVLTPVPEPSTFALFALGLLPLLARARRRSAQSA